MLGEMNKLKGTVSLNGKVSLISQTVSFIIIISLIVFIMIALASKL